MSWTNPVANPRITSLFNPRRWHPILQTWVSHTGVDYGAPAGTPVRAASGGVIERSRFDPPRRHGGTGAGNHVRINHGDGITTRYYHLTTRDVREGQHVITGQRIGTVGTTGDSTGPHLHFEVRHNGTPIDPVPFLASHVGTVADPRDDTPHPDLPDIDLPDLEEPVNLSELVKALLDADVRGLSLRERLTVTSNRATDARNFARAALEQAQTNATALVLVGNRALRAQQNAARAVADVAALAALLDVRADDLTARSDAILAHMRDTGTDEEPQTEPTLVLAPAETDDASPVG